MISVLIAEDHHIVRAGIKLMIENQDDMCVIGEADNGEDVVTLALEKKPDIIIMDLNMPRKNGLIATRQIMEVLPNSNVIVLTMHEDREYLFKVLESGASGYVLKSHEENDLIDAIRNVYKGGAYLYPNATKLLLEDYMNRGESEPSYIQLLTGREQEVLSLLAKGYTNREIADMLYLSIKTIESHRSKIMSKLKLSTRAQLVEYALKNGLLIYETN